MLFNSKNILSSWLYSSINWMGILLLFFLTACHVSKHTIQEDPVQDTLIQNLQRNFPEISRLDSINQFIDLWDQLATQEHFRDHVDQIWPIQEDIRTQKEQTGFIFFQDLLQLKEDSTQLSSHVDALNADVFNAWLILYHAESDVIQSKRSEIAVLNKLVEDFQIDSTLRYYLLEHPSLVDEWYVLDDTFRSLGDPVKELLGPGSASHPEEWKSMIQQVKDAGGQVEFTTNPNKIAYEPALSRGSPGKIYIQEDASITALRHEFQHFLDDQAEGFIGFRGLIDPTFRIRSEYNAYKLEMDAMKAIDAEHIVLLLKKNFENEVDDIMSKFGKPTEEVLNLVQELLNL